MKNSIVLFIPLIALAVFFLPGFVNADVSSVLYVQGPGGSVLVNTSLTVPESCTVVDNVGVSHSFSEHKAPCAIQAAKDAGIITDFLFQDFGGFGLYLKRVNGITDGPAPDFPYWNLWLNGVFSEVGINQIVLSAGDDFQLTYGPYITGIVSIPQKASGGPVTYDIYPRRVRVEDAVSFLVANQKQDGSWGYPLFTDWVAVALGAYKGNSTSAFYAEDKLVEWMEKNPIPEGSALTDFERRAMALMALGIDPYNGTGTDYIQKILNGFDGQQFGDANLVNDDMFALLVLERAGYEANVTPLLETLPFIFSWQRDNGSFGSTDLTAVAVQVLSLYPQEEERDAALARAKQYLAEYQESSGGFGNVYSTSWVLQAIASLDEDGDNWAMETDRRTPEHFLALSQALDGGLLPAESKENRIWATAYAIPAALGKSWGSILGTFEKPARVQSQAIVPLVAPLAGENEEVLEGIGQEVARISQKVAALKAEITLAYVEQELKRIALETKAVRISVVAFQIEQLAQNIGQPGTEFLVATPEPSPVSSQNLSGITLIQEDALAPFAAEARETVGAQGLSPQLIILLVLIGGAVFVFSGGINSILPHLRRTFSKV